MCDNKNKIMGCTENDSMNVTIKEENSDKQNGEEVEDLEWSADQEILLLYSLHGYKPVGPNKHFRMLLIQDRLSSAMNKNISAKTIWKKLNTLYDLEALDEAEAEADAAAPSETDFELPVDEYGEMMTEKLINSHLKLEDHEGENSNIQGWGMDALGEIKNEGDSSQDEAESNRETSDTPKGAVIGKETKKDSGKKGMKKKDLNLQKDNLPMKKDSIKEVTKKDSQHKKEVVKEPKKGGIKDDDKKEVGKKTTHELKKDVSKEDKKEQILKANKREVSEKKMAEQSKKDMETKKTEQKKVMETGKNQRTEAAKPRLESVKQLKTETPKRNETKSLRAETPKPHKTESLPRLPRVEAIKKESSAEKKKEIVDKKLERKSPEKTPETMRGTKLRTREKKDTELEKPETPTTGTKRERSRDSISKGSDTQTDEPTVKRPKGRPTRNSIEPQQKVASPVVSVASASPQKRRTRLM